MHTALQYIVPVGTLLLGGLISLVITRYYAERGMRRRLAVYVQCAEPALAIDPAVRGRFAATFDGRSVKDLILYQFVVSNDGGLPITNLIEPPTFTLPKEVTLLDARILLTEPEGRVVALEIDHSPRGECRLRFHSQLLNPGDYVVASILCDGEVGDVATSWTITGEGLPPRPPCIPMRWGNLQNAEMRRINGRISRLGYAIGGIGALALVIGGLLPKSHAMMTALSGNEMPTMIALVGLASLCMAASATIWGVLRYEALAARRHFNLPRHLCRWIPRTSLLGR